MSTETPIEEMTEDEVSTALLEAYREATGFQIAHAFVKAVKLGENEAAIGLLGMLAHKDPALADLIVQTIRYQPREA